MTQADTGILESVRLIILRQDSANVKSSELVTEPYIRNITVIIHLSELSPSQDLGCQNHLSR